MLMFLNRLDRDCSVMCLEELATDYCIVSARNNTKHFLLPQLPLPSLVSAVTNSLLITLTCLSCLLLIPLCLSCLVFPVTHWIPPFYCSMDSCSMPFALSLCFASKFAVHLSLSHYMHHAALEFLPALWSC
ncbi:hypothetical protein XENORESO_017701 [Xenotaenia resolanae]|uniref:Uncharacterized protein n=1 Tax=Xenotaenia resolanae TaxID=208358 RepID=A0ABV0W646_9TELE